MISKITIIQNKFERRIKTNGLFCLVLLTSLLFNVQNIFAQTISSFTPKSGPIGTTVTISGSGFNTTPANNIVFFGATRATVTAATLTSLTVTTPAGATFAPITVLNTSTGLTGCSRQFYNPSFIPNKGSIKSNDIQAKVDFGTGTNPYSVAIGDLNGDGKPDLVTANSANGPDVSVLKNTSTSGAISFATNVNYATNNNSNSVALGDLDGDGKLDIVSANPYTNSVSVFRNISSGVNINFDTKIDFSATSNCVMVAIGDINGDGKLDLIVVNKIGASNVSVLRNTSTIGNISFAANVDFITGANPQSVAVGDIDGDGKPDLAVANDGSGTVSVLRNTSTTSLISFATKVDFATDVNPFSIAIGDIDGDGKMDLAVANYGYVSGGNNVSVLRNIGITGTISFTARINYPAGLNPTSLSIGDLNGDGKPDLAVSNFGSNTVSILNNKSDSGSISFASKIDKTTGSNPYSVSIGDINGDGMPDIAVANSGTSANSVSVLKNSPQFPEITISGTSSSFSSCAGTASIQQNFTVRGKFLDSNILINAPSGFEISTNPGSGYLSTITLTRTFDSVPNTAVYVRMHNTATGSPLGNVTCTSTWASTQNIAVSGNVNSPSSSSTYLSICQTQLPYTWNGLVFDSAATKTKTGLINAVGCDSSASLTLSVKAASSSITNLSICPNQLPFTWNGIVYDSAATKTKTGLINAVGCDSSATLTLSVKAASSSITNLSICPNQLPYTWNGLVFDGAATKTKTGLINAVGCDSSATLNLNVYPNPVVGVIVGPQSGLFTSTNYVYTVTQQLNITYNWVVTNGIIVSGQGTNTVNVQFVNAGLSKIIAEVINPQGCRDTSSISLTVGNVGINKLTQDSPIILYPNPTTSELNLKVDRKLMGSSFTIIDQTGRIILTGILENEFENIQFDNFSNGIYLLNINDNLRTNYKIIKH